MEVKMIKVSDYIVKFLLEHGVNNVFMFVGGGAMHLNDTIGACPDMNFVSCLHEQTCAMAAESYARNKNDLGVAVVTTGPGATNTLTAVAAAWIESTQLFVISGQVKRSDSMHGTGVRQMGVQEVDIVEMVKPITKYAVLLNDPEMVRYELEKCVFMAKNGRPGPVLIDVPLDVQATRVDENALVGFKAEYDKYEISKETLDEIKSLLQCAKRPVIYAGAGVALGGARKEFLQFAEKMQIPILTTWNGMDLVWDDHPLYMGRPGAIGQRHANFVIQNSDLLIAVGTRLAPLQTGFAYDSYARFAKMIMVDVDKAELDKLKLHPYIKLQCDAKTFFSAVNSLDIQPNDNSRWIAKGKEWAQKYPVLNPEWLKESGVVNSYYLVDSISRQMTADDVYCGGRAGTCVDTVIHAFKVKKGQVVIATKGLSSMGYGLPAAIGAAVAHPGHRIVCNNGDGGFVMNIQDLATIKYHKFPIKFFILNNGGYATIVATQTNVFDKHFVGCDENSGLAIGNIKAIAEAYGIKTFSITNNSEIDKIVSEVLAYDGPALCDVHVSITQPIVPRQANYKTPEGQMASRPLEDMKPLLPETELAEIMSISRND